MHCKRCGRFCPPRPEGYCFHCLVGITMGLVTADSQRPQPGEDVRIAPTPDAAQPRLL